MIDFKQLAMPGPVALKPYTPGKPVEVLERELGITGSIKLASNENPLGCSPAVTAAVQGALGGEFFARYPDAAGHELKADLAAYHGIEAERITLGNGSNDILVLLAQALLGPGRAAVFSDFAFAVYPIATAAASGIARVAPALAPDSDMPYGHDLAAMAALIDSDVRLVFVANPNNPTGTWIEPDAFEAFLRGVPEDVVVVLDEAYYDYQPEEWWIDARRLLDAYPNLVVTRTFSKVYGIAAMRVGYGLSHPGLADILNRVRQPFNNNAVAHVAARAALADTDFVDQSVALNLTGLARLRQALDGLGLGYLPTHANFLTFDLGRDAAPVYEALLREGVIVRPLAGYGMPQHLRTTVGTAEENERFIEALTRVLAAH
ncbi:MAG: histidinol-phosphate transaminase [Abyssibacter sp.]|uniref:histidinol-phosphate transaminase n=1 Tax=Abyssibacter sp. TaxID=2320200 RepID=UPI00321BCA06